ncbi:uncharacterized protein J3R85_000903 [Psidium guajava]|nr:uncharacterized protein J3R85_000903 [Psidium guajava]
MSYLPVVRILTVKRHVALQWSPQSPLTLRQRMPRPAPAHFRTLPFCLAPVHSQFLILPMPPIAISILTTF